MSNHDHLGALLILAGIALTCAMYGVAALIGAIHTRGQR